MPFPNSKQHAGIKNGHFCLPCKRGLSCRFVLGSGEAKPGSDPVSGRTDRNHQPGAHLIKLLFVCQALVFTPERWLNH